MIDGAKALRRAIRDVFGERALVHRCQRHKERNVCEQPPEDERERVRARLRAAWALEDHKQARGRLQQTLAELERSWPDAARSLREGLEETLTLTRLGITGQLAKTLCSTNPCESMIEIVRRTQRNVKRWREGDMRKRWTAAGMLEAERLSRQSGALSATSRFAVIRRVLARRPGLGWAPDLPHFETSILSLVPLPLRRGALRVHMSDSFPADTGLRPVLTGSALPHSHSWP